VTDEAPEEIPLSPLFVVDVVNPACEVEGWVAVHSLVGGRASGGVRIIPDVSRREVELLAEAMAYKYSFHHLHRGGAKAGLRMPWDLPSPERARRLAKFGEHIGSLIRAKTFVPWADMNCSGKDIEQLYRGAGLPGAPGAIDSNSYTSCSTMGGVMAAAEYRALAPEGCSLTIEGFGSVGRDLALEIERWGGRLIGASTRFGAVANPAGLDVHELIAASQESDAWVERPGNWEVISRDALFELPMDIHVPCARIHSVTRDVAEKLRCDAVVPAANVACTPEGSAGLDERGATLLPDFLTNSGGVVAPRLKAAGNSDAAIRDFFLGDFKDMMLRLLRAADADRTTAVRLATREAHEGFRRLWRDDRKQRNSAGRRFAVRLPPIRSRGRREFRAESEQILRLTRIRFA
jgi:glutamate dehydrogenase/leucine dehydrogenase